MKHLVISEPSALRLALLSERALKAQLAALASQREYTEAVQARTALLAQLKLSKLSVVNLVLEPGGALAVGTLVDENGQPYLIPDEEPAVQPDAAPRAEETPVVRKKTPRTRTRAKGSVGA